MILLSEEEFWDLRGEIAQTIATVKGQRAKEALLEALGKVKHPRARRAIVRALSNFREKTVADHLAKILLDEEES